MGQNSFGGSQTPEDANHHRSLRNRNAYNARAIETVCAMARPIKAVLIVLLVGLGSDCPAQRSPGWSFWGSADGMKESYTESVAVRGADIWLNHGFATGASVLDGYRLIVPKVNGLEVLRQIKDSPNLARIPVVVISSSYEEVDLKEANKLGASAYVVKPVRFQDFVDAVKAIGYFWGVLNILPSEQHKYHANRKTKGAIW